MKILFLSRWFPSPPDNGAKLRILNLLKGLASEHEVSLLTFSDQTESKYQALREICHEIRVVPWREFRPSSLRSIVGFFSLVPRSQVDTYSKEMERELIKILSQNSFDLVILSQWQMAAYARLCKHIPTLYEEVEVGVYYAAYQHAQTVIQKLRFALTIFKQNLYFSQWLAKKHSCTVVSADEKKLLQKIVPDNDRIHVIPNGVRLKDYGDVVVQPDENTIIFTGSFRYRPNYDAMVWFISEIYPLIKAQVPRAKLTITGDHCGLPLPEQPDVSLTGFVQDIRPLIARSWVSVVPIQIGGGTRLKILEAMGLKVPVVSTTLGAEGIQSKDGSQILLADTPALFARKVIEVLQSRALRDEISQNAYQLIQKTYDWDVIMPEFLGVVRKTAQRGPLG